MIDKPQNGVLLVPDITFDGEVQAPDQVARPRPRNTVLELAAQAEDVVVMLFQDMVHPCFADADALVGIQAIEGVGQLLAASVGQMRFQADDFAFGPARLGMRAHRPWHKGRFGGRRPTRLPVFCEIGESATASARLF